MLLPVYDRTYLLHLTAENPWHLSTTVSHCLAAHRYVRSAQAYQSLMMVAGTAGLQIEDPKETRPIPIGNGVAPIPDPEDPAGMITFTTLRIVRVDSAPIDSHMGSQES